MKELKIRGSAAELWLYDEIDDRLGISAQWVSIALRDLKASQAIVLRLNSPGGSVTEAVAIYNALSRHQGNVAVHVDGIAASAASIVAMAGDEIVMAEGSFMMLHNPWSVASGEASTMRDTANVLDKVQESMVDIYARRTGKARGDIQSIMDAETWFSASEAVAAGFATRLDTSRSAIAAALKTDVRRFNYARLPSQLRATSPNPTTNEETMSSTPAREYAEMHWRDRSALATSDPNRFQKLRQAWKAAGYPTEVPGFKPAKMMQMTMHDGVSYAAMTGRERQALAATNPKLFRAMRREWHAAGCPAPEEVSQ